MGTHSTTQRFKTNPVEIAIFVAVTAIFATSVYRLFYGSPDFQAAALTKMSSNPVSEGRAPASVSQSFMNLEVKCDSLADQDTGASKIRLTGRLCGMDSENDGTKLVKSMVTNGTNKFAATVFTDTTAGKFSTDFIPLNSGQNKIHVEFSYRSGKNVAHDFVINKN